MPIEPRPTPGDLLHAREAGARLPAWYSVHGRDFPWRHWRDSYSVLIGEILLQRTSARVAADFAPEFLHRFPSWASLAAADETELEAVLSRIGLQRRRARTFRILSSVMMDSAPAELRDLPGVGQYIERAVDVTLAGRISAMVDTNFVRVVRRLFGPPWKSDYRYDRRLQALALAIVEGAGDGRVGNWSVLDLGATVCRPRRPLCSECPLADLCHANPAPDR